jgi:predicted nucleotidyltransferase
MSDDKQIKEILSKVRVYSEELFGDSLQSVILFGSYARGDYDDESDVDIMIIVDLEASKLSPYKYKLAHFGTTLDLEYEVFHSFTLQDKKTFELWKDITPFYKSVLTEGIAVNA